LKDDDPKKKIALKNLNQEMSARRIREVAKVLNTQGSEEILGSETDVPPNYDFESSSGSRANDFSRTIAELILVLRIALVRLDDLIAKSGDPFLRKTIGSKRLAVHKLIDELVTAKRRQPEMFAIPARPY
jgi:hypothetical protein